MAHRRSSLQSCARSSGWLVPRSSTLGPTSSCCAPSTADRYGRRWVSSSMVYVRMSAANDCGHHRRAGLGYPMHWDRPPDEMVSKLQRAYRRGARLLSVCSGSVRARTRRAARRPARHDALDVHRSTRTRPSRRSRSIQTCSTSTTVRSSRRRAPLRESISACTSSARSRRGGRERCRSPHGRAAASRWRTSAVRSRGGRHRVRERSAGRDPRLGGRASRRAVDRRAARTPRLDEPPNVRPPIPRPRRARRRCSGCYGNGSCTRNVCSRQPTCRSR